MKKKIKIPKVYGSIDFIKKIVGNLKKVKETSDMYIKLLKKNKSLGWREKSELSYELKHNKKISKLLTLWEKEYEIRSSSSLSSKEQRKDCRR